MARPPIRLRQGRLRRLKLRLTDPGGPFGSAQGKLRGRMERGEGTPLRRGFVGQARHGHPPIREWQEQARLRRTSPCPRGTAKARLPRGGGRPPLAMTVGKSGNE